MRFLQEVGFTQAPGFKHAESRSPNQLYFDVDRDRVPHPTVPEVFDHEGRLSRLRVRERLQYVRPAVFTVYIKRRLERDEAPPGNAPSIVRRSLIVDRCDGSVKEIVSGTTYPEGHEPVRGILDQALISICSPRP